MSWGTRDRRPPYGKEGGGADIESLERDNDRGLDVLAERVSLLKQATEGIKKEVDTHHGVLDMMGAGMSDTRGLVSGAVDKFKLVMSDKQNKKMTTIVFGTVCVLLLLWYLTMR